MSGSGAFILSVLLEVDKCFLLFLKLWLLFLQTASRKINEAKCQKGYAVLPSFVLAVPGQGRSRKKFGWREKTSPIIKAPEEKKI
jgi:hypothetical protein